MSKRLTIVLVLLCAVLTSARAGYYYKVYADSKWTDWIYAGENNYMLTNLKNGDKVKDEKGNEWSFSDVTKIERMAFKGIESNQYKILDNDDYNVFKDFIKSHLKELYLEDWQNTSWDYSYYFMEMTALEKVKLPNHDISMGGVGGLFCGCKKLKEVEFGNGTRITAMSQRTFDACESLSVSEVQKILNHFTGNSIPYATFRNCTKSTSDTGTLTFPTTVTTIGDEAFAYCTKVTQMTFPTSSTPLTSIGAKAFNHCEALQNFYVQGTPKSITTIGESAFDWCPPLTTESVNNYILANYTGNTIQKRTFYHCNQALSELKIPATITSIAEEAFAETWRLEKLEFVDRDGSCDIGKAAFRPQSEGNSVNTWLGCSGSDGTNTKEGYVHFGKGKYNIGTRAFEKAEALNTIRVVDGTEITGIGDACFGDCRKITSQAVNNLLSKFTGTRIGTCAFYGCNGKTAVQSFSGNDAYLTTVDIPTTVETIGAGAFGLSETATINHIIVHRAQAPTCETTSSDFVTGEVPVFRNINPNYVTIEFQGDAAGYASNSTNGYKSYQQDNSEFQRLLTKSLSEDSETYDVYPQMHAIVKLTRSFKTGWNTLCLPFGSPSYPDARDYDCAEIYKRALNPDNTDGFMIAAYRGLYKNPSGEDDVFFFLKYANVETDPLDEFEPLLVKMTDTDAQRGTYTFTDVDLNYDRDNNKLYSAAELNTLVQNGMISSSGKSFYGEYNKEAEPFKTNMNYTEFYFDGTFRKRTGSDFITAGDYIIQDNAFILCDNQHSYGLKAFRGFFKKNTAATTSGTRAISIQLMNADQTATDILRIEGGEVASGGDVFTLGGQLVRRNGNLQGLAKGIYIINGKKQIVK
ncbi:MAG: leucine-rich repeat protein [Prevotella sp.]|nr:leucine-rich repeat protein [Prevotella sp.]